MYACRISSADAWCFFCFFWGGGGGGASRQRGHTRAGAHDRASDRRRAPTSPSCKCARAQDAPTRRRPASSTGSPRPARIPSRAGSVKEDDDRGCREASSASGRAPGAGAAARPRRGEGGHLLRAGMASAVVAAAAGGSRACERGRCSPSFKTRGRGRACGLYSARVVDLRSGEGGHRMERAEHRKALCSQARPLPRSCAQLTVDDASAEERPASSPPGKPAGVLASRTDSNAHARADSSTPIPYRPARARDSPCPRNKPKAEEETSSSPSERVPRIASLSLVTPL